MSHTNESFFPFVRSLVSFRTSKKSVSIIINEGSTYGLDFIFWTGNDVKEATLTWAAQSLFQNSRQNPLDTTPTRPMSRTIQLIDRILKMERKRRQRSNL